MVTAYRASSHVHKPGDILTRPRGFRLATSVDAACADADWPLQVYEVDVDAAEARGDGSEMRARSCRIVRQLAPEEVLGPRAPEILAILDWIPHVGRCRPCDSCTGAAPSTSRRVPVKLPRGERARGRRARATPQQHGSSILTDCFVAQ
jgi:hypothetical protein